jgi:hypothetical protein
MWYAEDLHLRVHYGCLSIGCCKKLAVDMTSRLSYVCFDQKSRALASQFLSLFY